MDRRLATTFLIVLALAQLIPIWSVHYLPTTDGPSHLYNAWILRELLAGHDGLMARYFEIDCRPHPNWIGTALMAALMSAMPPLVAEKIFVSIIVLLFALAMWWYAASPPAALVGLLFTFHWLLQMGFYNHSLAVAVYFIAVTTWWRQRRRGWLVALLLAICYFANPMMVLLAVGSIGLLWLVTSRKPRELLAIAPVLPLIVWYLHASAGNPFGERHPLPKLLAYLLRARILYTFDKQQTAVGMLLLIVILLSVVPAFRERNVFLWLTAAMLILYFAVPETFGSAFFIRQRVALLVFLTPLAWIRLPQKSWAIALVAILVGANVVYLTIRWRQSAALVESAVRTVAAAPPRQTFRVIAVGQEPPRGNFPLLWHAGDYAAIDRQLVDVDNYEAETGYFPIRFRPGVDKRPSYVFELTRSRATGDR